MLRETTCIQVYITQTYYDITCTLDRNVRQYKNKQLEHKLLSEMVFTSLNVY